MSYVFLISFIGGLLLAVRLMFFGAERRRARRIGAFPLRRSEPAIVGFLLAVGLTGYLVVRHGSVSPGISLLIAAGVGAGFAAVASRLAIATARIQPEHDPDDPRFVLQGRVGVVTRAIPANGEGMIRYEDSAKFIMARARDIANGAIPESEEICIDRVEDGVTYVERWSLVEERL